MLRLARSSFLRWQHPDRLQIGLNCFQPFGFGYPFTNGGGNDATIMPDARLTKIKNVGFDFVRMVVDPEALLTADSASNVTTTQLDSRNAEVIAGIARRTALGLKVVVDFHFHGFSQSVSAGWDYVSVFDGGTKAARVGFVLARLAAAIHAAARTGCAPGMVCYELFNEPPLPSQVSTATYIAQIEAWWAQVRVALPLHTILVGGNNFNAMDGTPAGDGNSGLTAMTASHFDGNTGFVVHNYESAAFTHQGLDGTIYQYGHGIKWPATDNVSEQAVKDAWTAATVSEGNHDGVTASSALDTVVTQNTFFPSIHQFFLNYGSKAGLATYLGVATAWADSAGINRKRLFNTEFGCNFAGVDDSDDTSASNFVQAVRENASNAGLNCIVIHEMQGSNFGVQSTTTPWDLNVSIQSALFPTAGSTTIPVAIDLDFVRGSYAAPGLPAGALASVIACARSTTKYAQWVDGHWSSFAINVPAVTDLGLLAEDAVTNNALWCRDATNAAWVKTTMTVAKDQVGIDNVAASASSLLATGANATIKQSITLASAQQTLAFSLKRLVGVGAVLIALDGSTYTDITAQLSTSKWTRVRLTATLANPVLSIKLATNGDKIGMDFAQVEQYPIDTSPILTTTVAMSRSSDIITLTNPLRNLVLNGGNAASSYFTEVQQTRGGPNSHVTFVAWNSDFSQLVQQFDNGLLILAPDFSAGFSPTPNNAVPVGTIVRTSTTCAPGNVRYATSLDARGPQAFLTASVQTSAQYGMPGVLPTLSGGDGVYIGSNKFGSFLNSYIRRFSWVPVQVDDVGALAFVTGDSTPVVANTETSTLLSGVAAASLPQLAVSFHQHTTVVDKAIPDATLVACMQYIGAKVGRLDCDWQQTEPSAGVYDFSGLDATVAAIRGAGITTHFVMAYGNFAYSGSGDFFAAPADATYRGHYNSWITQAVTHFGVSVYEIWNEPNLGLGGGYAWAPNANASDYSALLTGAAAAVKAVQPTATVVSGGLSPGNGIAPNTFIVTVAAGTLTNVDWFGLHPYNSGQIVGTVPEQAVDDVASFSAAASALKPVSNTEDGYSQDWLIPPSQTLRAYYVARLMMSAVVSRVKQVCVYDLICDGTDPLDHESNFGLFDYNYNPLPAANAYATIAAAFANCVTYSAISLPGSKVYDVTFTKASSRTRVIWGYNMASQYTVDVGAFSAVTVTDVLGNAVSFQQVGTVLTMLVGNKLSPLIVNLTN